MILKALVLVSLIMSQHLSASTSGDLFKVAPYTLKHTTGQLILNFQLKKTMNLLISDDGIAKKASDYQGNKHYQIRLGNVNCDKMKEVKIFDSTNENLLFENSWPSSPCQQADTNEPFVFGFISDTQQYFERHASIAQVIANENALSPMQFLVNGGDVVQEGDTETEWIKYFLGGRAYLQDIPQIAAIGNHDYRGYKGPTIPKFFKQLMRWEGADKYGNLFFDFPKLQLLILNSNFSRFNEKEDAAIWNWVEEKASRARRAKKPLIVATHFPVYSSSLNRFFSAAVIKMNEKLVPIAEKYKIPLILSGHTHMYERSYRNGVHYLVAGPAGGRVNKPSKKNKYMKFIDPDSLTFTRIKYLNGKFEIETYNQDHLKIDSLAFNLK